MLTERTHFRKRAFDRWQQVQGHRIKAARPAAVYDACAAFVRTLIDHARSDVHHDRKASVNAFLERHALSADQIADCEQRALSQRRVAGRGFPSSLSTEAWQAQMEAVRAETASGLDNPPEQA